MPATPLAWTILPAREFAAHQAEWDELQARCMPVPFLESSFIQPLLQVFAQGNERLVLGRRGTQLSAAAIVVPKGMGRWETLQPSQLPLGAWLGAADEDMATAALSLLPRLPGFALSLGITQSDPMLTRRPADGATVQTQDYVETAHVLVQGEFGAYWEARGKNLRQNTRKQRNKLAADGISAHLDCLRTPESMAEAIADFGRLESAGWKADTGTAVAPDNDQGRFYTLMLRSFAAHRRARVYRYRFGDKVVAMDLCIVRGEMIVILKTAYDESYRTVSPSVLMREDEFFALFAEARFGRIEFYGKVMEWHTRWTELRRMLFHTTVYRMALLRRLQQWRKQRAKQP